MHQIFLCSTILNETLLRSYLNKKDECVNEEAFLEEMVQKFGPKILQSYPELWNERVERIERLRAETNLNVKGGGCKSNKNFIIGRVSTRHSRNQN